MENLLALLLQARNVAHVHHWKVKSFSLHMALGELYDLLEEFADSLAEMSMGAHGSLGDVPHDVDLGLDKVTVLGFISQLFQALEGMKGTIPQDSWLINKYEELQASVSTIKYKMENLN
jgi:hypothetical protein